MTLSSKQIRERISGKQIVLIDPLISRRAGLTDEVISLLRKGDAWTKAEIVDKLKCKPGSLNSSLFYLAKAKIISVYKDKRGPTSQRMIRDKNNRVRRYFIINE